MEGLAKVLIVGQSRVVRAALAKHLHEHFAIREESNGEAAWESLVLDSSIVAILAEAALPKLDAFALIERMHARKLQRLSHTPVLLIVSGTDSEEERQRARARGVAGFVARTMQRGEILTTVRRALHQPAAQPVAREASHGKHDDQALRTDDVLGQIASLKRGQMPAAAGSESEAQGGAPDRLLNHYEIVARGGKTVRCKNCSHGRTSVILFGLDSFAGVSQRQGPEVAARIESQLASLLVGRLGRCDAIGHYGPGQLAIVSCGTDRAQCQKFAGRVEEALAKAHITVRGVKLSLGISVGIANAPEDGEALTAPDLFALAEQRLGAAMAARRQATQAASQMRRHEDLFGAVLPPLEFPEVAGPRKEILPLLKMINQEFSLGLPLAKVEGHLARHGKGD